MTVLDISTHDDLDCPDVNVLLSEASDQLREAAEQIATLQAQAAATEALLSATERRATMLAALNEDLTKQYRKISDDRGSLSVQVSILHEELAAAEKDAVPVNSLLFSALPREQVTAIYRRVSRVTRGPLPPSVLSAVDAASADIVDAMAAAGTEALEATIRREVRRRRRTATRRR